jgi:hypothetical protein
MQIPYKWIAVGVVVALLVGMLGMVVWTPATVFPLTANIVTVTGTTPGIILGTTTMLIPSDALADYTKGGQLTFTMKIKTTVVTPSGFTKISLNFRNTLIILGDNANQKSNIPLSVPATIYTTSGTTTGTDTIPVSVTIPSTFLGDKLMVNVYASYHYVGVLTSGSVVDGYGDNLRIFLGEPFATLHEPNIQPDTATWKVMVVDSSGQNYITGATVTCNNIIGVPVVSEGMSYYQMTNIPIGVQTVTISKDGYITQTLAHTFTVNEIFTAKIWLSVVNVPPIPPGANSWTVTILDNATSKPIVNATIKLGTLTGITNAAGQYTFTAITPGRYALTIKADGYASKHGNKTIVAGAQSSTYNLIPNGGFDWLPTIILGAIGGVIFLLGVIGYSTRSNPVYLFLGFAALAICLIVGLMLSFNLISFESGAVITGAIAWLK